MMRSCSWLPFFAPHEASASAGGMLPSVVGTDGCVGAGGCVGKGGCVGIGGCVGGHGAGGLAGGGLRVG